MTLRGLLVAGLLVTLLGCVVFGNVAPTMEDQYVTTVQDTAVTFTLRAQDEDIDPLDPGGHSMRFVILDGPTHGVLIGDLSEVRYVGPHDAFVEVTYVPAGGFIGTDYVTITVIDPFDETASGTTTIQIDVERARLVGLLSGNWDTSLTFNVQTFGVSAFRTKLTEVYRIGQLVVQGIATWKYGTADPIFDSLRFQADFPLGYLIKISSTLAFDPNGSPLFDYWCTTTSFSLFDTSFNHTFYLTTDLQTDSYQTLTAWGTVGDVRYSNTVTFDMNEDNGFCFSRENLSLSWVWCDLQVSSTVGITDAGFQSFTLSASDYPVPGLVMPNFGLYLDLALTFTPTSKMLTPTFTLKTAWIDCIKLLTELDTSGASDTSINGFSIYGIKLKQALGDGIAIQMATSFDNTKNSSVTGQSDYFELFLLSGRTTSCCGVPGTWSVATYFACSSTQLFDWGMTLFKLNMGLTNEFSASTEIAIRSGTFTEPTLEITFGWTARW
jgi:hypothetical protein